jgi:hypothetical protein
MDMNNNELYEHVDHQRWLINNGFINDLHKDTLYLYGSIVHKDIQAVYLQINIEDKVIKYTLYVDSSLLKKLAKYKVISKSKNLFRMWQYKRMLQKEGNLDFNFILSRFVQDYCGPKWTVELVIDDFKNYVDGFEQQKTEDAGDTSSDQPPNA